MNSPDRSPVWWRFYAFLAYRHGFLQLSLGAAALVGAYRILSHRPLFGGWFDFLLGLAAGALVLTLLVTATGRSKAP